MRQRNFIITTDISIGLKNNAKWADVDDAYAIYDLPTPLKASIIFRGYSSLFINLQISSCTLVGRGKSNWLHVYITNREKSFFRSSVVILLIQLLLRHLYAL